ncbi:hypothetical protein A4U64_15050 [Rhodococcus sp. WB1]|nr:hypothetical protein A4U64_15050 [Rhodococcus sp. WB1]
MLVRPVHFARGDQFRQHDFPERFRVLQISEVRHLSLGALNKALFVTRLLQRFDDPVTGLLVGLEP